MISREQELKRDTIELQQTVDALDREGRDLLVRVQLNRRLLQKLQGLRGNVERRLAEHEKTIAARDREVRELRAELTAQELKLSALRQNERAVAHQHDDDDSG